MSPAVGKMTSWRTLAEPIADPDDRLDRLPGPSLGQLAPQVADRDPDGIREGVGAVVPDVLQQALRRHDLARVEHQIAKERELLRSQVEAITIPMCLMPGGVEIEASEMDGRSLVDGRPSSECADARRQLREAERLDKVIVRAVVETTDSIVEGVPGRQHQHARRGRIRDLQRPAPELAADVTTVTIGQTEIEAHHVVGRLLEVLTGVASRGCRIDGIALPAQPGGKSGGEVELVLDDEQSHGRAG